MKALKVISSILMSILLYIVFIVDKCIMAMSPAATPSAKEWVMNGSKISLSFIRVVTIIGVISIITFLPLWVFWVVVMVVGIGVVYVQIKQAASLGLANIDDVPIEAFESDEALKSYMQDNGIDVLVTPSGIENGIDDIDDNFTVLAAMKGERERQVLKVMKARNEN